ncbi:putative isomerase YbhE [Panus rudis PR-1116 ss-1]|nr:putative isomerase YbhE [Panus rudis PR-1116 ss-1]
MVYQIYVGSYSNEIYTLSFDPDVPSLSLISTITVGHHPSWITPDPKDPSVIFAGIEQTDGKIVTVKYDDKGKGVVLGEVPSGGGDPCTLLAHKDQLIVGNYSSGTVAFIPLSSDGPHLASTPKAILSFTGTGPNKDRQEASHPHQVVVHPDREELLVPDLGSDKTRRLTKDEHGNWVAKGEVVYPPGGGPRHVAFYKDNLYTLLELTSELTAHKLPPLPETPTLLDKVPTMKQFPPNAASAGMLAAEILIPSPNSTFSTPYLYASNRNDPSPEGDTISIYSIANPEKIEPVSEVKSGLKHLRGMAFGGPDDKYLVAGGALGGGVKVFERIDGGSGLKELARVDVAAPTGFLWV